MINIEKEKQIREWHNLVVQGLCNGLTHTHRDDRTDDIAWVYGRLKLFESFSRATMNLIWGKDYSSDLKELKEVAKAGYSL